MIENINALEKIKKLKDNSMDIIFADPPYALGNEVNNMTTEGACTITKSNSELGQKYEGYKYSISPMKQNLETIMIFQKETKNKSILDDLFAFENGDKEISPCIWDINNNRVPIEKDNLLTECNNQLIDCKKRANKDYKHNAFYQNATSFACKKI